MTPTPHGTGGITAVLTITAILLLVPVLLLAAAAVYFGQQAEACTTQPDASSLAISAIPARYLALFRQAGLEYGIPWEVLAAIGEIESDDGRSGAPGVHSGSNSVGAAGPMQFGIGGTAGNTWGGAPIHPASQHTSGYGIDGDRDGLVDVYDPGDAIPSAARCSSKTTAPPPASRPPSSTGTTPPGTSPDVLALAARYTAAGGQGLTAATSLQCAQAIAGPLPPGAAGQILGYAEAQLGKPYLWGATGPDAFDCSGLAMMAYRAAGLTIPRTSQQQWAARARIPAGQARPGDLVFFVGSDGTWSAPGHVGILTSPTTMIDAPGSGQVIRYDHFSPATAVGYTQPASS